MSVLPLEKDAVDGPVPIEVFAGLQHNLESQTVLLRPYKSCYRYRPRARWLRACRSLLRFSGSIPCSIRFETINVFRR